MSVSLFLKRNFVAVLSVALPLLLVLALLLLRGFAAGTVAPPAHDLLLISNNHDGTPLEFSVEQGRFMARYVPAGKESRAHLRAPQLLYLDVSRQTVRPIPVELPMEQDGSPAQAAQRVEVPELAGLTLSTDSAAPDGYRFERAQQSGSLFRELFGSRSPYRYVLAKDGRRIAVRDLQERYNVALFAWVIDAEPEK